MLLRGLSYQTDAASGETDLIAKPRKSYMATILVVDDSHLSRRFLVTLLGYFDHEMLEAGDGGEALESLRSGKIDLAITDVLMPTMDGYEFLHRLRAEARIRHTPVIFYTAAKYAAEARAMAEACGVRHFLTKPAAPQVILAAVTSALGGNVEHSATSLRRLNRHALVAPSDPIDPNAVVFIVDNDRGVRDSLSGVMSAACLKTETFSSAEEFLGSFAVKQPGCLVLDVCLPGMSGIALLETLRSRRIHIPAIILTACGDVAAAVDAMRLRVLDFLPKPAHAPTLLTRVYRALQEDTIKRRENAVVAPIKKRMGALTFREKQLVTLLTCGKTSKEIAHELQISVKTVSHHRAHLMAKTGAANLGDLVRMNMIALER